jgi:hypothetical protein
MKSPIFIFSLPRAGSTLLQRILMSHSQIASVAEPWLMLPFCYAHKSKGVLTEYNHSWSSDALEDFISNLPNGENDYFKALNEFASALYQKQCVNNETYFLDKTPRYYFIIPEILKIFPDAKIIFLFRNPLQVMSSIIETWCDGNLRELYSFERDLNFGLEAISTGYELLKDRSYAIQYDEFVVDPEQCVREICDYLNLDFEEAMLSTFSLQDTKGRMGDPKGVNEYSSVTAGSLDKWKASFSTSYRKKVAFNYIDGVDEFTLKLQGYDKKKLLQEVQCLEGKHTRFIRDRIDITYSMLVRRLKANIFFGKKIPKWAKDRFLS